MIFDDLKNASRYAQMHPGFAAGFEFLSRPDLASLPGGRHEIDGDRVFALVNRDPGRGHAGARLESHRKYIDIQLLVSGQEEIGWRLLDECQKLTDPYDAKRDIMFFADAPLTWIVMAPGKFLVFWPEDAHAPLAATGDNVKVVIKVAV